MSITKHFVAFCLSGLFLTGGLCHGETPPAKAKTAVKKFVNSKDDLTGDRDRHYADFSVEYPENWRVTRKDGSKANNFVDIERGVMSDNGNFTFEKFDVGTFWCKGNGSEELLAKAGDNLKTAARKELVDKFKKQFLAGFPNSKITSEGVAKLGDLNGYEIGLSAYIDLDEASIKEIKADPKMKPYVKDDFKRVNIWAKFYLIPDPNGGENGVFVALLGTSVAPELNEEKDLGVKGELPGLIKSLKLGKPAKE